MKYLKYIFALQFLCTPIYAQVGACLPTQLTVITRFDAHTYEARLPSGWPVVLTTTSEVHKGFRLVYARKTGVKNFPTTDGFSQQYMLLKQCPPSDPDHWADN